MLRCALPLALGLGLLVAEADAEESRDASRSPLRTQMREATKAKVLAKPADAPRQADPKLADQPIVMQPFIVTEDREKQEKRAREIVEGQKAMEERLSYHPLFNTDRVEILRRPMIDDLLPPPGGRLKLDIFNLKW